MLSNNAEEKYQKAVTKFMTALAEGDKKQAKLAADEVFVYIDIRQQIPAQAGSNSNPYYSKDNDATKVMLKSLEHLIAAGELAHKHKRVEGRSASLVADAKQYASSKDAKVRAKQLELLVQKYSDKAQDYRIGMMTDQEINKELESLATDVKKNLQQYSAALEAKLRFLELDNLGEAIVDKEHVLQNIKNLDNPVVGSNPDIMNKVSALISMSIELIEVDATIESRAIKVQKHDTQLDPDFNKQQSKSYKIAIKLVDALYKLVEFVFSLGDRLKVLVGMETKEAQRKNMIWKQMNKHHPAILQQLDGLKEQLQDNNEQFNRIRRRCNV